MKQSDVIVYLRRELGISEPEAKKCLEAVLSAIQLGLIRDESVEFRGFGRFSVKKTPARPGRNPATNEAVTIPAGVRIGFKASNALKEQVAS